MSETLSAGYFEKLYQANDDPWEFATSSYEAGKYRQSIAALGSRRYRNAFEIGCSIGVLTALLAQRCDHLLSVDVSEKALSQAQKRCQGHPNVEFRLLSVPRKYPEDRFDLTVVSEVGYYLSLDDLKRLSSQIQTHTLAGGQLLLVHWLPAVHDYPLTGDQVHAHFLALNAWSCVSSFRAEQYRIELLQLGDSQTVEIPGIGAATGE